MADPTPTPNINEDTRRWKSVQQAFDKLSPGVFGLEQWENLSDDAKNFLYESLVLTLARTASPTPVQPTPTPDPDLPPGWNKQVNYTKTR